MATQRSHNWLMVGAFGAFGLVFSASVSDCIFTCLTWPFSWLLFYGGVALSAINLLSTERRGAIKSWVPLAVVLAFGVIVPRLIHDFPSRQIQGYFAAHKLEYEKAAKWLKSSKIAPNQTVEVALPENFFHLSVDGSATVVKDHGQTVMYFPREFSQQDDGRLGIAYIPTGGPISKHLWENGPLVESPLGGNWYQTWN